MQQHLNRKPPPLASLGARVPQPVEKALQQALEKDPNKRFADATAMRVAFEQALALANDPTLMAKARSAQRARKLALVLGAAVAFVGAGGGAYVLLRHHVDKNATTQAAGDKPPPDKVKPAVASQWLEPHTLPDLKLVVDQKFEADGLRVEATGTRDAGALRDRYKTILEALREFMRGEKDLQTIAETGVAPLTVVVVPQSVLEDAKRWPGYVIKPDMSYPSRYVDTRRTLFIADAPGFETQELPYGVAMHALVSVKSLSTERLLFLAEKFEAYYTSKRP
jgi:hypothetical protein